MRANLILCRHSDFRLKLFLIPERAGWSIAGPADRLLQRVIGTMRKGVAVDDEQGVGKMVRVFEA